MLHAGGKFGGEGYKVSGGLHGVGVSVVNALSERLDRRGRPRRQAPLHGVRQGRQAAEASSRSSGRRPAGRTGTTVTFWPDPTIFAEVTEFRARTVLERLQMMAFLNKGLEIRFHDERPSDDAETGRLPVHGRHRRLRQAPQRVQGGAVHQGRLLRAGRRRRPEVEIAFQWNTGYYDGIHCFANGISTIEGGMHVEGFKTALTNVGQQVRPRQGPAQGEGREPPRRGHPRGPHRHHLGASCATRSSRARPRPSSATSRCARSCRRPPTNAGRVARGEPHRGQRRSSKKAHRRGPGPRRGQEGPRRHPPQDGARRRRHARQAQGLLQRATPTRASCSSSRATRPAARPSRPAIRARRRSCRSAARSSTSSGPASTRC